LIGLLTGTFVGAGLAMWCAPRSNSELRERLTDSANTVGNRAYGRDRQRIPRIRDTVDDLAKKARTATEAAKGIAEVLGSAGGK
jgi:gas vesicle protein